MTQRPTCPACGKPLIAGKRGQRRLCLCVAERHTGYDVVVWRTRDGAWRGGDQSKHSPTPSTAGLYTTARKALAAIYPIAIAPETWE